MTPAFRRSLRRLQRAVQQDHRSRQRQVEDKQPTPALDELDADLVRDAMEYRCFGQVP